MARFDVFGTTVEVTRRAGRWLAFYPGTDGKKRPATDIVIPDDIPETGLEQYLADLCHEWATPKHQEVTREMGSSRRHGGV